MEKDLLEACLAMRKDDLHRLMVSDASGQNFQGSITFREILLFIIRNYQDTQFQYFQMPIEHTIERGLGSKKDLKIVESHKRVYFTFELMIKKNISSIPIVDENKQFLGIIKKFDIYYIV